MLKNSIDRSTLKKQIAVCTASTAFTQLLEQLLVCWGFRLCRPDANPEVLNVFEAGCCQQREGQTVLWLQPGAENKGERLGLPLDIEVLWQTLEQYFHSPPRMHMRRTVDLPARVLAGGEWQETRISSLSDMGARFSSDRELVKQQPVTLDFRVDGATRRFDGRVIFSMAAQSKDAHSFQSGVVFDGRDKAAREELQNYLIRQYLEVVRAETEPQIFQDGLAFFALAPELRCALLPPD